MYSATALRVQRLRVQEAERSARAEANPSPLTRLAADNATRDRIAAEQRLIAERDPQQREEMAARDRDERRTAAEVWADLGRRGVAGLTDKFDRGWKALSARADAPSNWFQYVLQLLAERVAGWLELLSAPQTEAVDTPQDSAAAYSRFLIGHRDPPTPAGDTSACRITSLTAPHGPDRSGVPVAA